MSLISRSGIDRDQIGTFQIEKEYVKVQIYFKELQVESIFQEAQLPLKELIVSLGGALSLWLGLSFVTLVEVAEFFCCLLFALVFPSGYRG